MSHGKDTYDNYRPQRARVAQSEWRLNDKGRIEDMVRQVRKKGQWVDFGDSLLAFLTWPVDERRVIWRAR